MTKDIDKNLSQAEAKEVENDGAPVCSKCGSILVDEEGELVCPDCAGEIDFFGDSPS